MKCHSDMAVELMEDLEETDLGEGISMEINWARKERIKETVIRIKNESGEKKLGKPCGCYITFEGEELSQSDEAYHEHVAVFILNRLEKMLVNYNQLLVIGLGNRNLTADALGPLVAEKLYVNRHLVREGLKSDAKQMSALVPGVMAQTGMESFEIIKGIVEQTKPDVIVAIDALAARNVGRLNHSIQISDTGIIPGSGVGNHRKEITEKTMGCKVIAIGVPTVISLPSILRDAVEEEVISDKLHWKENWDNLYVTPKNIDEAVEKISFTIAEALNHFVINE